MEQELKDSLSWPFGNVRIDSETGKEHQNHHDSSTVMAKAIVIEIAQLLHAWANKTTVLVVRVRAGPELD